MESDRKINEHVLDEGNKIWYTTEESPEGERCILHFPMRDEQGKRPEYIIKEIGLVNKISEASGANKKERSVCHVREGVTMELLDLAISQDELKRIYPTLENIIYGRGREVTPVDKMNRLVNHWKSLGLVDRKDPKYYTERKTWSKRKNPFLGQPLPKDVPAAKKRMEDKAKDFQRRIKSGNPPEKSEAQVEGSAAASSAAKSSTPAKSAPEQSAPKKSTAEAAGKSTAGTSSRASLLRGQQEPARATTTEDSPKPSKVLDLGNSILTRKIDHQPVAKSKGSESTHLRPRPNEQPAPAAIARSNSGEKRRVFREESFSETDPVRAKKPAAKKSRQSSPAPSAVNDAGDVDSDSENDRSRRREGLHHQSARSRSVSSDGLFVTQRKHSETQDTQKLEKASRKLERGTAAMEARFEKKRAKIDKRKEKLNKKQRDLEKDRPKMRERDYRKEVAELSEERKTIGEDEYQLDSEIALYHDDFASSQSERGTPAPDDRVVLETLSQKRGGARETRETGTRDPPRNRERSRSQPGKHRQTETPIPSIEVSEPPKRDNGKVKQKASQKKGVARPVKPKVGSGSRSRKENVDSSDEDLVSDNKLYLEGAKKNWDKVKARLPSAEFDSRRLEKLREERGLGDDW